MVYRESEDVRSFRERSRQAVKLAMESRWEEAAALNRELTLEAPDDLDSYNRLGRALLEQGDLKGARSAFEHSLRLDPANSIAKKNLERLSNGSSEVAAGVAAPSHKLFIGEAGKSAQVALLGCQPASSRPYVAPGVPIELRVQNGNLVAFTCRDQYLGLVPPGLGRRLVLMMEGGNQYGGAVVSSGEDAVQVLLHETFQHPSMRSKLSFPPTTSIAPEQVAVPSGADDDIEPPVVELLDEEPIDLMGLDLEGLDTDDDHLLEVDVDDVIEDEEDDEDEDFEEELDEAI
jgi:hypothetical protein